jgi:hypothetical protein
MAYVSSFPKESDGGLYQILLLKKQMRFHTKFYSSFEFITPSDSWWVKLDAYPHLIIEE